MNFSVCNAFVRYTYWIYNHSCRHETQRTSDQKIRHLYKKSIVWWRHEFRSVERKAGIKGRDKWLHPTGSVSCNYLFPPFIPASGTTLLNWKRFLHHWLVVFLTKGSKCGPLMYTKKCVSHYLLNFITAISMTFRGIYQIRLLPATARHGQPRTRHPFLPQRDQNPMTLTLSPTPSPWSRAHVTRERQVGHLPRKPPICYTKKKINLISSLKLIVASPNIHPPPQQYHSEIYKLQIAHGDMYGHFE